MSGEANAVEFDPGPLVTFHKIVNHMYVKLGFDTCVLPKSGLTNVTNGQDRNAIKTCIMDEQSDICIMIQVTWQMCDRKRVHSFNQISHLVKMLNLIIYGRHIYPLDLCFRKVAEPTSCDQRKVTLAGSILFNLNKTESIMTSAWHDIN